jgi:hypothetical protein
MVRNNNIVTSSFKGVKGSYYFRIASIEYTFILAGTEHFKIIIVDLNFSLLIFQTPLSPLYELNVLTFSSLN